MESCVREVQSPARPRVASWDLMHDLAKRVPIAPIVVCRRHAMLEESTSVWVGKAGGYYGQQFAEDHILDGIVALLSDITRVPRWIQGFGFEARPEEGDAWASSDMTVCPWLTQPCGEARGEELVVLRDPGGRCSRP